MKRNFKKAIAFALATVTVVANFGVSAPVKAAEYEPAKDVVPAEYENYEYFNDGVIFASRTEVKKTDGESQQYVDELVFVDKNGEKSTMEVKNTDGSYKYTNVSWVSDDCLAMLYDDDTYALYFADGTWFGNGTERYKDICILRDGNFIVSDDTTCSVVDKTGKVIAKDIFTPTDSEYVYWWPNYQFADYLVLGRNVYVDEEYTAEIKLFDKSYKQITTIDFTGYQVSVIDDTYLVLRNDKTVTFYDSSLKKLDYVYKRDVVTNPSPSTESVLVDYEITGVWKRYDYNGKRDVIEVCMYCCTYNNALDETASWHETVYLDAKTFAEIDGAEIDYSSETEQNVKVDNTDVTYKNNNGVLEFYYGTTKLYDVCDLVEYLVAKKSAYSACLGMFCGSKGDLFLEFNLEDENYEIIGVCTLVLTKEDKYSLEKATILDKDIIGCVEELGGIVYFADDTFIFNGKTYDKDTSIRTFWRYNDELGIGETNYYIIQVSKDGAVSCTLYDKNHTEIAKTTEEILSITGNGHIVIGKEDSEGNRLFGCKYVKKILVSTEDILEEITYAEEGDTIEVSVKKNEPVKAKVFEEIKGKDIALEITTPSGITWTLNGKDITGTDFKDIDFTVDIVKDVVPTAAIDKIKLDGEKIELSLAHSGDFGFTATMKINLKAENTGKYANLFYYNPTTKKLEFQGSSKIDANGDAGFKYTHASDYVIFVSDVAYDESPGTADTTNMGMLIAVLAVAAGAVVVMQKKRESVK
ncbi:MAG: hypothetical protein IJF37_04365 [Lachnospiraceae bacterium]|nr:hypothetical protein [Lachnospiraceae bacterium]